MEDFKEIDIKEAWQMIKAPAVVATKGKNSYDLTPYGWIMPLDYDPVTKVIFSSDPGHQAVFNIKDTKEFAVCIPKDSKDKWIEQTGSVSDAKADKFALFNIKAQKASSVDVMIPKENITGWIEFTLIRTITEGSVELVLGQAVKAYSL